MDTLTLQSLSPMLICMAQWEVFAPRTYFGRCARRCSGIHHGIGMFPTLTKHLTLGGLYFFRAFGSDTRGRVGSVDVVWVD